MLKVYLKKNIICWVLLLIIVILPGCVLGPAYVPPTVNVPKAWGSTENIRTSHKVPTKKSMWAKNKKNDNLVIEKPKWWECFNDPTLNYLVEEVIVSNLDLKTAIARVQKAQAEYEASYSRLIPKLTADALPPTGNGQSLVQLLSLTATWLPDVFGKLRQESNGFKAIVEVNTAEKDFVQLNVAAEVATAYMELRENQAKNKLLRRNLEDDNKLLAFVKQRYDSGVDNYIGVAQQDSLIETELAELSQNEAVITMLINKIETLVGKNPGFLVPLLSQYHPIPHVTKRINLGVPSDVLRRRPDILASEYRVVTANANVGAAIAALFPEFSIGYLSSWQSQQVDSNVTQLMNTESRFFGLFHAPLIDLTLYKNIALKNREKAVAVLQYQTTVLQALHEVSDQYSFYKHHKVSYSHLSKALNDKQLVLKLEKDRYAKNVTEFSNVLRAEEELNRIEIQQLHSEVAAHVALINLYKALGGGI